MLTNVWQPIWRKILTQFNGSGISPGLTPVGTDCVEFLPFCHLWNSGLVNFGKILLPRLCRNSSKMTVNDYLTSSSQQSTSEAMILQLIIWRLYRGLLCCHFQLYFARLWFHFNGYNKEIKRKPVEINPILSSDNLMWNTGDTSGLRSRSLFFMVK